MNFDWQRLLAPKAWIQLGPTDWEWDAALNMALDNHSLGKRSFGYQEVGPFMVWINNYPYGYGNRVSGASDLTGLPSYKTRKRLKSEMGKTLLSQAKGEK